MNYTIYDPATGEITATITSGNTESATITLGNSTYIKGNYSGKQYYIDIGTREPVELPAKPVAFLQQYVFDWTTHNWILDTNATAATVRTYRNALLAAVDKVNPVWFASLTADQQTELATYRQALLNVPQQSGFPTTVEWPVKPTWLA